jgi:hypothetical protein
VHMVFSSVGFGLVAAADFVFFIDALASQSLKSEGYRN